MNVLLGIIGHSPVLENYPLGPILMKNLEGRHWDEINIDIENMTWSPIHVVQRLQDLNLKYDRAILVGVSAKCNYPGKVWSYKWTGGFIPEVKVQERIYEGVTGVVSLDNTLVIGDYFKIWPEEIFTVEVEMHPDTFGEIVIAEDLGDSRKEKLKKLIGFDPVETRDSIENIAYMLGCFGNNAFPDILEKKAQDIHHPELFIQNSFITKSPTLN
jgi:hypothetical protein